MKELHILEVNNVVDFYKYKTKYTTKRIRKKVLKGLINFLILPGFLVIGSMIYESIFTKSRDMD